MKYFVSRQHQWMTGNLVVEIAAGGLDYSGPDMLSDPNNVYGPLGNMLETSDPREALKAAFAIRETWHEELRAAACNDEIHIEAGYNLDIITPTEEPTDEQLWEWAQAEWDAIPKCAQCGQVAEVRDAEEEWFCTERCMDNYYHEGEE